MNTGGKPIGHKAYGSIPHLKGSRRGEGDHGVNDGVHRICTEKARDKHDFIVVQEKLDGSCCAVYRDEETDRIIPLTRAGWEASTSTYLQHRMFNSYVLELQDEFRRMLNPGERAIGEWVAQAHGTRYSIPNGEEPFVVFDIMKDHRRLRCVSVIDRLMRTRFNVPPIIHCGGPISIKEAMERLGMYGKFGAIDPAEGLVYRVERDNEVDFLAKYVHPDKVDGAYLPKISGGEDVWNWVHPNWSKG